jgi:PilZ domain
VPAESSVNEKRDQRRQRVLKAGTIAFNGSAIDCVVRNISATGAALEVENQIGIPLSFRLIIAAENFSEHCRVLWRRERRLGVVFEDQLPI